MASRAPQSKSPASSGRLGRRGHGTARTLDAFSPKRCGRTLPGRFLTSGRPDLTFPILEGSVVRRGPWMPFTVAGPRGIHTPLPLTPRVVGIRKRCAPHCVAGLAESRRFPGVRRRSRARGDREVDWRAIAERIDHAGSLARGDRNGAERTRVGGRPWLGARSSRRSRSFSSSRPGSRALSDFSHVIVLFRMHRDDDREPEDAGPPPARARRHAPGSGVFAQRGRMRPNPGRDHRRRDRPRRGPAA